MPKNPLRTSWTPPNEYIDVAFESAKNFDDDLSSGYETYNTFGIKTKRSSRAEGLPITVYTIGDTFRPDGDQKLPKILLDSFPQRITSHFYPIDKIEGMSAFEEVDANFLSIEEPEGDNNIYPVVLDRKTNVEQIVKQVVNEINIKNILNKQNQINQTTINSDTINVLNKETQIHNHLQSTLRTSEYNETKNIDNFVDNSVDTISKVDNQTISETTVNKIDSPTINQVNNQTNNQTNIDVTVGKSDSVILKKNITNTQHNTEEHITHSSIEQKLNPAINNQIEVTKEEQLNVINSELNIIEKQLIDNVVLEVKNKSNNINNIKTEYIKSIEENDDVREEINSYEEKSVDVVNHKHVSKVIPNNSNAPDIEHLIVEESVVHDESNNFEVPVKTIFREQKTESTESRNVDNEQPLKKIENDLKIKREEQNVNNLIQESQKSQIELKDNPVVRNNNEKQVKAERTYFDYPSTNSELPELKMVIKHQKDIEHLENMFEEKFVKYQQEVDHKFEKRFEETWKKFIDS